MLVIVVAKDSNLWLWTMELNVSHWLTITNRSSDINLIVCYLDVGWPMWWSYLCDRCSTPLHLQSQPAPSLQAVDLNSSESTQWVGEWCMVVHGVLRVKSRISPTSSPVCLCIRYYSVLFSPIANESVAWKQCAQRKTTQEMILGCEETALVKTCS